MVSQETCIVADRIVHAKWIIISLKHDRSTSVTNKDRHTVLGEEQTDPARGKKQQDYVWGKGRGMVKRQVVLGKLLSELLDLQGWENMVHALLT